MSTNPFTMNSPFYKKTWAELGHQMPYASDMQRYEAAERLVQELDTLFFKRVRELAFEYEEHDRIARERKP